MNLDLIATPQQALLCGVVSQARQAARGPGAYVSRKLVLQTLCYVQAQGLQPNIPFTMMLSGPVSPQVLADFALLEQEGAIENRSVQPASFHDYHLGLPGISLLTKNADWLGQANPKIAATLETLQPFKKAHLQAVGGLHYVFLTLKQFGNPGPYRERCVDEVLAAQKFPAAGYREYLGQTFDTMVAGKLVEP